MPFSFIRMLESMRNMIVTYDLVVLLLRPWQKSNRRKLVSNYHNIMDYFFPSPKLLRIPKAKGIAAAGTARINRVENAPLQPIKEMEKLERGASDVITDNACLMKGQQSGESSVYICRKTAPQESPSLYQSSKWQG